MIAFITILIDVLLPIFLLIIIGFTVQKRFQMNLGALAKLNIYVFIPAFIFAKFYKTTLNLRMFGYIVTFFLLYILALYLIAQVTSLFLHHDKAKATTLNNSVLFFNSGNYGAPVNDMVFKGDPVAMSVQVIVLTLQNLFTFTYGIFAIQSVQVGKLRALLGYLKMPILYALVLAVVFNYGHLPVPDFAWTTIKYLSGAMIPIALLLLGGQIAQFKFSFKWSSAYIYIIIRLIIGPVVAALIIKILGFNGMIAQALFIASAMPTSVNSSVIAQEYDNYPELAAQLVFLSTLLSTLTVVIVIYLSNIIF
ncbi:AEC family transporter [Staphylococcus sp. SQ8-PEA]|uniref:AEC family transporter n=1 Tax=Staphylococcus marylandisciuri TaxID=2981529 RepID=A0ABT2QNC0_9STAP|nr:AEC family transporter [Staphylococcus marylandisciuri]MCU5745449.1 AEC family transporter [Staphylococcus marylandisciuri]